MTTENKTTETVETDRISNETASDALNATGEVANDDPIEQGKPNKEAAKYRRQLREVEKQLETITSALTATREQTLELMLGNLTEITVTYNGQESTKNVRLKHTSDLQQFTGKTANDLLDDDGNIDRNKIADLLKELYAERPELFEQKVKVPNIWGRPERPTTGNDWKGAFTPNQL